MDPDDTTPSGGDTSSGNVSPRIQALNALAVTPRRIEVRRLAAAMREVIEHLVSTTASTQELARAADQLESLAELLRELPKGGAYQGFAEVANAGPALAADRAAAGDGGAFGRFVAEADDPERFAVFDDSPFIGLANPLSPPMVLEYRDDRVTGTVTFGSAYEGPPGCVHGGYVAAAFDELLGATQSLSGTQGMTAHLEVEYRKPTPLRTELEMEGWLEQRDGRKIWAAATIRAEGQVTAEARGLFIAFDPEKFLALLDARDQRMG